MRVYAQVTCFDWWTQTRKSLQQLRIIESSAFAAQVVVEVAFGAMFSVLALLPFGATAQQGTVHYSHTYPVVYSHYFALRAVVSEASGKEFTAPATHSTLSRTMVYDATASLMYPTDKAHVEPEDLRFSDGEEHVDTTYVSMIDGRYVESRVVGMDVYRVRDQTPAIPWRLANEERVFLGHPVMKAVAAVDSAEIEAWYAPEIPIPGGPGKYGGLPGLILIVINSPSGEVYAADSLQMDVLARPIKPPVRGRTVSDRRYERIKRAVMDEDRRIYERELRDIREGRMIVVPRSGQE